jgi:peptidoglycan/xylan/chitin deacetylase (PgdA/CDA1 family)
MTHRYLNDLGANDLTVEISESKQRLEDITGNQVAHFSCPGGRINSTAKKIALDAGYRSVATSRIGLNTNETDRFALTRVAVKRGVKASRVEAFCRGEGLFSSQVRETVLLATKHLLGNSMYERVRAGMLRQT